MTIKDRVAAGRTRIPSDPQEQIAYFADPGNQITDKLTTISTGVQNDNEGYIGSQLMPVVSVTASKGSFYRWNVRAHDESAERPLKGVPAEIDTKISTETYETVEYALQSKVDRREISAYPEAMEAAVSGVTETLMISREIRAKTLLTTTGNYDSSHKITLSGTSRWSDYASGVSDPLTERDSAINAIRKAIFRKPNVFACGIDTFLVMTRHPALLALNNQPSIQVLTEPDIARLLMVDRILIGTAHYNSGNEVNDTDTAYAGAGIWDNTALFAYIPPSPGQRVPALAYTFELMSMQVTTFADPLAPQSNQVVQVSEECDELMAILSGKAGYLVDAPIA